MIPTMIPIQNYRYDSQHSLGYGTYGIVYRAYKGSDLKTSYAMKKIEITHKSDFVIEKIQRGLNILSEFQSENVIKLFDKILLEEKNQRFIYGFFECCEDGSLQKKLQDSPLKTQFEDNQGAKHSVAYLDENEVIPIMLQIVNVCRDLARKKIIHRDLKPNNILFKNQIAKIIDFDFAKYIDDKNTCEIGTYGYKSPEVFFGDQNIEKCDIWSVGMIIFELLYGRFPWVLENKCQNQFYKVEAKKKLQFPEFPTVSSKMKKLIRKLLVFDFNERLDWNGIWKIMEELEFVKEVELGTPTKKSKTKVNVSLYYENSEIKDKEKTRKNLKKEKDGEKTILRNKTLENISKKEENSRSNSLCIPKKLEEKYSKKNDDLAMKTKDNSEKDEELKYNENHKRIIITTKVTKKTMIDLQKFYSDQKDEEWKINKEIKKQKIEKFEKKPDLGIKNFESINCHKIINSINVKLKFATFFDTCFFYMNFNIERKTIFFGKKNPKFLKNQILGNLACFANYFIAEAQKNWEELKKIEPFHEKLRILEKNIKNHESNNFFEHKSNPPPPSFEKLRLLMKKFLKKHKLYFLKENEDFLVNGEYDLLFYRLFCFSLRIAKAEQVFGIFTQKEKNLLSETFDDFFINYEKMKENQYITEIREGFQIK